MRRRSFLRASSVTGVALTAGTTVSASPSSVEAAADVVEPEFEPLGRVSISGAAEAVVADDGETVYVAATGRYDGFVTVDVSDPADPTILAERRDLFVDEEGDVIVDGDGSETARQFNAIFDVDVDGDRLVVPGPANEAPDSYFHGFLLFDVSDRTDPVPVGDPYETDFHIHNCFFQDDLVYLVGNDRDRNPLVIVDVSHDEPVEVGRWSLLEHDSRWRDVDTRLWYLHDVFVQDGVAYLPYWNAGTYLLDVSDPANPAYISHVAETSVATQLTIEPNEVTEAQHALPGNDHYSAVDETGDLMAVGREAWATERGDPEGSGGIDLYDISDPENPEPVSTIDAPETSDASYNGGQWTTSHNFELYGGLLFSSWYLGGVKVHDVTDPSSPEELAHWEDRDDAAFWTARIANEETFVASSTQLVRNAQTEGALYTFPIGGERGNDTDEGEDGETARENGDESRDRDQGGDQDQGGDGGDDDQDGDGTEESDTNSSTDDTDGGSDELPGFTAPTTLAGGGLALEWLRRRSRASPCSRADSESGDS